MMARVLLSLVCVAVAAGVGLRADEPKDPHHAPIKHAGLDKFKQLAGDWVGKMSDGKDTHEVVVQYRVTSNGSAVVETMGPGTPHEMVTVIHPDGDALVLTHYCSAGNQPKMKADVKADANTFDFQFVSGTNMKSDKDMHMHNVTYTLTDKDTLKADWTMFMDGKKGGTASFELKRKKEPAGK
jgi:hypothetical protein